MCLRDNNLTPGVIRWQTHKIKYAVQLFKSIKAKHFALDIGRDVFGVPIQLVSVVDDERFAGPQG
jgi:hypothetical protein